MRERATVGIRLLIGDGMWVSRFPLSHTRSPLSETEISCDTPDALQNALAATAAGGRIIIRSGTCTGNFTLTATCAFRAAATIA